jgi:hypothetical protein
MHTLRSPLNPIILLSYQYTHTLLGYCGIVEPWNRGIVELWNRGPESSFPFQFETRRFYGSTVAQFLSFYHSKAQRWKVE